MTVQGLHISLDIVELLIAPLQTLNHSGVKIELPSPEAVSKRAWEMALLLSTPHGLASDDTDTLLYGCPMKHIKIYSMLFELVLDQLRGPTADILRRERFRNWDSGRLMDEFSLGAAFAEMDDDEMEGFEVEYLQHLIGLDQDYDWFRESGWCLERLPKLNPDFWTYLYPDGIPAKRTKEWRVLVEGIELEGWWAHYAGNFYNGIFSEKVALSKYPFNMNYYRRGGNVTKILERRKDIHEVWIP